MANTILQQGKETAWLVDEKGAALVTSGSSLITNYDAVGTTLAYVGKASAGAGAANAVWQIKRLTFSASGDVTTAAADGNLHFDNVWANRAILNYS